MDHPDHIRTLISAKNPVFGNPEHTTVLLDCHFEELKELGHVRFQAIPGDVHDHGRDILQRALAGEFGAIKPYPVPLDEQLRQYAVAKRDRAQNGSFKLDGIIVTDDHARALLNAGHIRAERDADYKMPWLQDGAIITLSAAQVIKISDAVHDHDQKVLHAYAGVLAGIKSKEITTRTQIDAIFDL